MNFRIVENAPPDYLGKYDLFVDLYNEGVLVEDIRRELGWSVKEYNRARKHALECKDITDRQNMLKGVSYRRILKRKDG